MRSTRKPPDVPNTPLWEKVMGSLGFILLCSGIAYLGWLALTEEQSPPQFFFEIKKIHVLDAGFLVEVDVTNGGTLSVAALHIQGELRSDERVIETTQAEFDYLPSRSKSTAGFFFTEDPRAHKFTLKALGYQKP